MFKSQFTDKLLQQLLNALPESLSHCRTELEKNFHNILQTTFAKFDLVTRDEFDAQVKVLQRTRQKLEALEKQLKAEENSPKSTDE